MTGEDNRPEASEEEAQQVDHDGLGDTQHEQAENTEHILRSVDPDLEEHSYPVTTEELSNQYRGTEFDIANETESWGSVFDRMRDRHTEFETPDEAREALVAEVQRMDAYDEEWTDEPQATDPEAPEPEHVEATEGEPGVPSEESVEDAERPEEEEAVERDAERQDVDLRETE